MRLLGAFEARKLGMIQGLTDTPQQALTRQFDAMLAEAVALGASYENVINWYVLQRKAIRDQAEAARQAEQEAAEAARQGIRGSHAWHGSSADGFPGTSPCSPTQ